MTMLRRLVIAVAFFFSLNPASAQLSLDPDAGPKVKAQVIAENDGIAPGKAFWVALRQEITPGWHTYWSNPGDTGLATQIDWQLPQGFDVSELKFPTPHRQPTGELMNFGYENEVLVLAEITPPAMLSVDSDVEIKGKASWLVCQEVCIPESASFLLTLPVTPEPAPGPWASAFTATRAKLPKANPSMQNAVVNDETIILTIDPLPLGADEIPDEAYFFPHDALLIKHSAPQKLDLAGRKAMLTLSREKSRQEPITHITGDIWFRSAMGETSYEFKADIAPPPAPAPVVAPTASPVVQPALPTQSGDEMVGLLSAIVFAFLGGLILNLMPCVFPILSLKALGLVHKAHTEDRDHIVMGGLVYTLGVMASFAVLGIALVTLKAAGHNIGWGAQLQSPKFVAAMALLLFFIGYWLSGAITLGSSWMGIGNTLANKKGHLGSFFTGMLAVIVATPCTAPFMGGAVFYALTQHWSVTLAVMFAMGLGLAFPYLLLTLVPGALRFMPRPGIWMEHFKQFLAFPMFAAALWLTWVVAQQTGPNGVLFVMTAMLSLAFGFWLWGTTQNRPATLWQYFKKLLAVIAIVLTLLALVQFRNAPMVAPGAPAEQAAYEPYSKERLSALRSEGRPVFVNMTAAWCITCLANEKAALSTDAVRGFFQEHDVTYLKGDWTNYDDAITEYLKGFGRSGVPIYVFYPADQSQAPVVLPQLLTPDTVLSHLQPFFTAIQPTLNPSGGN
jgi:thiol:disulfide interchange protein/DsbC/DsbD-like thiol-disulfide interchange protein